jgi:hypothetical protein
MTFQKKQKLTLSKLALGFLKEKRLELPNPDVLKAARRLRTFY